MVTDFLITTIGDFVAWVLGIMPTLTLPVFLTGAGPGTLAGTVHDAAQAVNGFGLYLPGSQIVGALTLTLAGIVVGIGVKVVRIIASFLTAGGGSAA